MHVVKFRKKQFQSICRVQSITVLQLHDSEKIVNVELDDASAAMTYRLSENLKES